MNRKQRRYQASVERRRRRASKPKSSPHSLMLALEPRYMFDGAAVVTVDAVDDGADSSSDGDSQPQDNEDSSQPDDEDSQTAQTGSTQDDEESATASSESSDDSSQDESDDSDGDAGSGSGDEQEEEDPPQQDTTSETTSPDGGQDSEDPDASGDADKEDEDDELEKSALSDGDDSTDDQSTDSGESPETGDSEDLAADGDAEGDGQTIVFVDYRVKDSDTLLADIDSDSNDEEDEESESASADALNGDDSESSNDDSALDSDTQSSVDDSESMDSDANTAGDAGKESGGSKPIVVYVNEGDDGIEVMRETLAKYDNVSSVHVLAHGGGGNVLLGNTSLNRDTLEARGDDFKAMGESMTEDGDILLYGCYTAEGESGAEFVDSLADATGADVGASEGRVGDGNWDLNYQTGSIEANIVVGEQARSDYAYALATFQVTAAGDVVDGDFSDGNLSLREALIRANATGGLDYIEIDASATGSTIGLDLDAGELTGAYGGGNYGYGVDADQYYGDLDITDDVKIRAINGDVTIDASGLDNPDRVFHIYGGATTGIYEDAGNSITITGGDVTGGSPDNAAYTYGGGILNQGALTLDGVNVEYNAAIDGGGIYNAAGATLTIQNTSDISNNTTTDDGGGLFNAGSADVYDSSIDNNTAGQSGGGLFNALGADIKVDPSTISGNSLYQYSNSADVMLKGAGVYNAGTMDLDEVVIENNEIYAKTAGAYDATALGAGIFNSGTLSMYDSYTGNAYDSRIGDNLAKALADGGNAVARGGGAYNSGALDIDDTTFTDNTVRAEGDSAVAEGGSIHSAGTLDLANVDFIDTDADGYTSRALAYANAAGGAAEAGGGILFDAGTANLDAVAFEGGYAYADSDYGNAFARGGGLYHGGSQTLTLDDESFSGNVARANADAAATTAYARGGGLYDVGTVPTTIYAALPGAAMFDGNTAVALAADGTAQGEGGAVAGTNTFNIDNVTIQNNLAYASVDGGLAYGLGGAIAVAGTANIGTTANVNFVDNKADARTSTGTARAGGGTLYNDGTLDLQQATFNDGGDAYSYASEAYAGSTDTGTATASGGIVFNDAALTHGQLDFDYGHAYAYSAYGNAYAQGGAFYQSAAAAAVDFDDESFDGNVAKAVVTGASTAYAQGGAIYNAGDLDLTGTTTVTNNLADADAASGTAYAQGGALYAGAGSTTGVVGIDFYDNTADADGDTAYARGGAIYNAGTLTISNTAKFDNNLADADGGTAVAEGGAIFNTAAGGLTVTNSYFNDSDGLGEANRADANATGGDAYARGGAVHNEGVAVIDPTPLSDNVTYAYSNAGDAFAQGGAVYNAAGGDLTLDDAEVSTNTARANIASGPGYYAYAQGGGLWNAGYWTLNTTGTAAFTDNLADADAGTGGAKAQGGAIYNVHGGDLAIDGIPLERNVADAFSDSGSAYALGGALFAAGGKLTVGGTSTIPFTDNKSYAQTASGAAHARGGTLYNYAGELEILDATFASGDGDGHVSEAYARSTGTGTATGAGGILFNNATLTHGQIYFNYGYAYAYSAAGDAYAQGGAVYQSAAAAAVDFDDESFDGNVAKAVVTGASTAYAQGGAIYNAGDLDLTGTTTVTNNLANADAASGTAYAQGGALYAGVGSTTGVVGMDFVYNTAGAEGDSAYAQGGVLFNAGEANLDPATRFDDNVAYADGSTVAYSQGGAVYNAAAGNLIIDGAGFHDAGGVAGIANTADANSATGAAHAQGGAIWNAGYAGVSNSAYFDDNLAYSKGNTAAAQGGAIYNAADGILDVANSFFNDKNSSGEANRADARSTGANVSTAQGGAIWNAGSAVIDPTPIAYNIAYAYNNSGDAVAQGGGVYNGAGGSMTLDDDYVYQNTAHAVVVGAYTAYAEGGGLFNAGGADLLGVTKFYDNLANADAASAGGTARASGGGIYAAATGITDVNGIELYGNRADADGDTALARGGAIFSAGDLDVYNVSSFDNNTADAYGGASSAYGGAIYSAAGGTLDVDDGLFDDVLTVDGTANTATAVSTTAEAPATARGGAIWSDAYASFTTSTIANNVAYAFNNNAAGGNAYAYGGGIYTGPNGDLRVNGGALTGNAAYAKAATGTGNTATARGGGIADGGGYAKVYTGTAFDANLADAKGDTTSTAEGGAIYSNGELVVHNSDFDDNTADAFSYNGNATAAGGAIHSTGNSAAPFDLLIKGSDFTDTGAPGLANQAIAYTVDGATAYALGGAVYTGGYASIYTSTFYENRAYVNEGANPTDAFARGGAIYNTATGDLEIDVALGDNVAYAYASYLGKTAYAEGGAAFNAGTLVVNSSSLTDNTAFAKGDTGRAAGGGIFNTDYLALKFDTYLALNEAYGRSLNAAYTSYAYGGGLFNSGYVDSNGTDFLNNKAYARHTSGDTRAFGGAIHSAIGATIDMSGDELTQNFALAKSAGGDAHSYGGGVFTDGTAALDLVTFDNNKAYAYSNKNAYASGGGIHNDVNGTLDVLNSSFVNYNTAYAYSDGVGIKTYQAVALGGAIENHGDAYVYNTQVDESLTYAKQTGDGYAKAYGGGIYSGPGPAYIELVNNSLTDNWAKAYAKYAYASGGGFFNSGTAASSGNTESGNKVTGTSPSGGTVTTGGGHTSNVGYMAISGGTYKNAYVHAYSLNGNVAAHGGAILNFGTLVIEDSDFYANYAYAHSVNAGALACGGAIASFNPAGGGSATVSIYGGKFGGGAESDGNFAKANGYSYAKAYGGAISAQGDLNIYSKDLAGNPTPMLFQNNYATAFGSVGSNFAFGGALHTKADVTIQGDVSNEQVRFIGNRVDAVGSSKLALGYAKAAGGALYATGDYGVSISDATFDGNVISAAAYRAKGWGGAIFTDADVELFVDPTYIQNNQVIVGAPPSPPYGVYPPTAYAYAYGGGVVTLGASTFQDTTFYNNLAYAYAEDTGGSNIAKAHAAGGGLFTTNNTYIYETGAYESLFDSNEARAKAYAKPILAGYAKGYAYAYGGGLAVKSDTATVDILDTTFKDNDAFARADGLPVTGGNGRAITKAYGGAIYSQGVLSVDTSDVGEYSKFYGNTAYALSSAEAPDTTDNAYAYAEAGGGAVFTSGSATEINNSGFKANYAHGVALAEAAENQNSTGIAKGYARGGAIYNSGGLDLYNNYFGTANPVDGNIAYGYALASNGAAGMTVAYALGAGGGVANGAGGQLGSLANGSIDKNYFYYNLAHADSDASNSTGGNTFVYSDARAAGGGLYNIGDLYGDTLSGGYFKQNAAYAYSYALESDSKAFPESTAIALGGGFFNGEATLTLYGGPDFLDNDAYAKSRAEATSTNITKAYSSAYGKGGGLYHVDVTDTAPESLTIGDTDFTGNTARGTAYGYANATASTSKGRAYVYGLGAGGGLFAGGDGTLVVNNGSYFDTNTAYGKAYAYGFAYQSASKALPYADAFGLGGGVFHESGATTFDTVDFHDNTALALAKADAVGIYYNIGKGYYGYGAARSDAYAKAAGGAAYLGNGDLTASTVTVTDNDALADAKSYANAYGSGEVGPTKTYGAAAYGESVALGGGFFHDGTGGNTVTLTGVDFVDGGDGDSYANIADAYTITDAYARSGYYTRAAYEGGAAFANGIARAAGGGLYETAATTLDITGGELTYNIAKSETNSYADGYKLAVSYGYAYAEGGGAYVGDSITSITDTDFTDNRAVADAYGYAISYGYGIGYAGPGPLGFGYAFGNAEATARGGGLFFGASLAPLTFSGIDFYTNTADAYADTVAYALFTYYNYYTSTFYYSGKAYSESDAYAYGGGFYREYGDQTVAGTGVDRMLFQDNLAEAGAVSQANNGYPVAKPGAGFRGLYGYSDANAVAAGGALRLGGADSNLTVNYADFYDNKADAFADAYGYGKYESDVNANATAQGGAISHVDGILDVNNSTFDDADADDIGNDAYAYAQSLAYALKGLADSYAGALAAGGAIHQAMGPATVANSTFTDNRARAKSDADAYGKFYVAGPPPVTGVADAVADAEAGALGGSVYTTGLTLLDTLIFTDSLAEADAYSYAYGHYTADSDAYGYAGGGAVFLDAAAANQIIKYSDFYDNTADAYGFADADAYAPAADNYVAYEPVSAKADGVATSLGGAVFTRGNDLAIYGDSNADRAEFDGNSADAYGKADAYTKIPGGTTGYNNEAQAYASGYGAGGAVFHGPGFDRVSGNGTLDIDYVNFGTAATLADANKAYGKAFSYALAPYGPYNYADSDAVGAATGGAVRHGYGPAYIDYSGFYYNKAEADAYADADVDITAATNKAYAASDADARGGGLYAAGYTDTPAVYYGRLAVADSKFYDNQAYVERSKADADAGQKAIAGVQSYASGGGIWHGDGTSPAAYDVTISDSKLYRNNAYVTGSEATALATDDDGQATATVESGAFGGGLRTGDGVLYVDPSYFNDNNAKVLATTATANAYTAVAKAKPEAAGGAIQHGVGNVYLYGAFFKFNDAYVDDVSATADSTAYTAGLGSSAFAQIDGYAYGGGVHTGTGNLYVGKTPVYQGYFDDNNAKLLDLQADATNDGVATAKIFADAAGGGIDHNYSPGAKPGAAPVPGADSKVYIDYGYFYRNDAYVGEPATADDAEAYAYSDEGSAYATVDATAFGGGLRTAGGTLVVTDSQFGKAAGDAYSNNAFVANTKADAQTSAAGYQAYAKIYADAIGGGIDHGDGDVTVTDSGFYYNKAFATALHADADATGGGASVVYAKLDANALGGGIDTGDGLLTVTVDDGTTKFYDNQAYIYDVKADAFAAAGTVHAKSFVDAAGGGVSHGLGEARLYGNDFFDNAAFVDEVDSYAENDTNAAYALIAGTAYGGGLHTEGGAALTVGKYVLGYPDKYGNTFFGNTAFFKDQYAKALAVEDATTKIFALAAGGGIDHNYMPAPIPGGAPVPGPDSLVAITDSYFYANKAYVGEVGTADDIEAYAFSDDKNAYAYVYADAFGGGVRSAGGELTVTDSRFGNNASDLLSNNAFVAEVRSEADSGGASYSAFAKLYADAVGGGIDHGDGNVTVSDSGFHYNEAYARVLDAEAKTTGAGAAGFAKVDANALGGGIDTGDGELYIDVALFKSNQAYVYNVYSYVDAASGAATAQGYVDAAGGGVNHGKNEVYVYDSRFESNAAYVDQVKVKADNDDGPATALIAGTAYGGGLHTEGKAPLTVGKYGDSNYFAYNKASFTDQYAKADASGGGARATVDLLAGGGAIDHNYAPGAVYGDLPSGGNNLVTIVDSDFYGNEAYVGDPTLLAGYDIIADAFSSTANAYARADVDAYGGGVRTAGGGLLLINSQFGMDGNDDKSNNAFVVNVEVDAETTTGNLAEGKLYADAVGGAIDHGDGYAKMYGGRFYYNEAYVKTLYADVDADNDAVAYGKIDANALGGGIDTGLGTLTLDPAQFKNNQAYVFDAYADVDANDGPATAKVYVDAAGGGVNHYQGYAKVFGSFFGDNAAFVDQVRADTLAVQGLSTSLIAGTAYGGGLHTGGKTALLLGRYGYGNTFQYNRAFFKDQYAEADSSGADARATVDLLAGGGAIDHNFAPGATYGDLPLGGSEFVFIYNSDFYGNEAYVGDPVLAGSDIVADAFSATDNAYARADVDAYGGGLRTADGLLRVENSKFGVSAVDAKSNNAFVVNVEVDAYTSSGGLAEGKLYADAVGGGIAHGDGEAKVYNGGFYYNEAYIRTLYADVDGRNDAVAYGKIDANALGGGIDTGSYGSLTLYPARFENNQAYIIDVYADVDSIDGAATAKVYTDAAGGGVNHGRYGAARLYDTYFEANAAFVDQVRSDALADGAPATSLIAGTAYGGGVHTDGKGPLTVGKEDHGNTFYDNQAFFKDQYAKAASTGADATATVDLLAGGGAIDHNYAPFMEGTPGYYGFKPAGGTNVVSITESLFYGNKAYVGDSTVDDDIKTSAYSENMDALATVDADAYGGGLRTANGVLTVTDAKFGGYADPAKANEAYITNIKSYAYAKYGDDAQAKIYGDAVGGGIDHGNKYAAAGAYVVTITDSGFYYNKARIVDTYAYAKTDADLATSSALVDLNTSGGGIDTGNGQLTVNEIDGDTKFYGNLSGINDSTSKAFADVALAQLYTDARGGGIHHGDGLVELYGPVFKANQAYLNAGLADADTDLTNGDTATALIAGTAYGGGLHTGSGDLFVGEVGEGPAYGAAFTDNSAKATNQKAYADSYNTATATVDLLAGGGGIDHNYAPGTYYYSAPAGGTSAVSVTYSKFYGNRAYIGDPAGLANDIHAAAYSETMNAYAQVDVDAFGGGVRTAGGSLTVTDSQFGASGDNTQGNNAFVVNVRSDAYGQYIADARLNADAVGGGIDHADGDVTITRSGFYYNSAYTDSLYAEADGIYDGYNTAYALLDANAFGGGIDTGIGTVGLTSSPFSNNSARVLDLDAAADGYYAEAGILADVAGGGVRHESGELSVTDSAFGGNQSYAYDLYANASGYNADYGEARTAILSNVTGGGIDHGDGAVTLAGSSFGGNTAYAKQLNAQADYAYDVYAGVDVNVAGGGLNTGVGTVAIDTSPFGGNSAILRDVDASADGYYAEAGILADVAGGGVRHESGELSVLDSGFGGNQSYAYDLYANASGSYFGAAQATILSNVTGGGIDHGDGDVALTGSGFGGNTAYAKQFNAQADYAYDVYAGVDVNVAGGGLNTGVGTVSIDTSPFGGNSAKAVDLDASATDGYYTDAGILADVAGGGVWHQEGALTVTDSAFGGNQAYAYDLYANVGYSYFEGQSQATILSNVAGGGIDHGDGAVTLAGSSFGGNTAYAKQLNARAVYAYDVYAGVDVNVAGGGLNTGVGTVSIDTSPFGGNSAKAVDLDASATDGYFAEAGILADVAGGGVRHESGDLNVTDNAFGGNRSHASDLLVNASGYYADYGEARATILSNVTGGGIDHRDGALMLTNSGFYGNTAYAKQLNAQADYAYDVDAEVDVNLFGGAVYHYKGDTTVVDGIFANNYVAGQSIVASAGGYAGASNQAYSKAGVYTSGGGLASIYGKLYLGNTLFDGNYANSESIVSVAEADAYADAYLSSATYGGGVYHRYGDAAVGGGIFDNNFTNSEELISIADGGETASAALIGNSGGGGLFHGDGVLDVGSTYFRDNSASLDNAVAIAQSTDGAAEAYNYSAAQGGGVMHRAGDALFQQATFLGNSVEVGEIVAISGSEYGDSAAEAVGLAAGGGMAHLYGGRLTVNNGSFDGNSVRSESVTAIANGYTDSKATADMLAHGGGLYGSAMTVNDSQFTGNTATAYDATAISNSDNGPSGAEAVGLATGGGLSNRYGGLTVNNGSFDGNSVRSESVTAIANGYIDSKGTADMLAHGGGLYGSAMTVNDSQFTGNTATAYDATAISNSDNGPSGAEAVGLATGGGLSTRYGGGLTVNNVSFDGNSVSSESVTAIDAGYTDSKATAHTLAHGGGLYHRGLYGSGMTVNDSRFTGNAAAAYGATAIGFSNIGAGAAEAYTVAAGGGLFDSSAGGGSSSVNTSGFYDNSVYADDAVAIAAGGAYSATYALSLGGGGAIGHGQFLPYDGDTDGTLAVNRSTLAYNQASSHGGGGFNNAGTLMFLNSTISYNDASMGGGLANSGGTTHLNHVTINGNYAYSNGGGAFSGSGGMFIANNSIIANSTGGGDVYGSFISNNHNLIESTAGSAGFGGGDITGQDPLLGALAFNGGPTQTHLPAANSPAIDNASGGGVFIDQRGVARPQGSGFDIGAVEIVQPPEPPAPPGPPGPPPPPPPPPAPEPLGVHYIPREPFVLLEKPEFGTMEFINRFITVSFTALNTGELFAFSSGQSVKAIDAELSCAIQEQVFGRPLQECVDESLIDEAPAPEPATTGASGADAEQQEPADEQSPAPEEDGNGEPAPEERESAPDEDTDNNGETKVAGEREPSPHGSETVIENALAHDARMDGELWNALMSGGGGGQPVGDANLSTQLAEADAFEQGQAALLAAAGLGLKVITKTGVRGSSGQNTITPGGSQ